MEPQDTLYLTTTLEWKAMSHPLRIAIVRLTRPKAMTNEELAKAIGVASGKLYFHTKMLVEAGLIRLVGQRQKAAITEKLYRATAMHFQTEPSHGAPDKQFDSLDSLVDLYKNTAREYPDLVTGPESLIDYRLLLLTPEAGSDLKAGIQQLITRAVESSRPDPASAPMALTVLYHRLPAAARNQDSL
jgi:DNA-binding transcriptional ArsR family regulator